MSLSIYVSLCTIFMLNAHAFIHNRRIKMHMCGKMLIQISVYSLGSHSDVIYQLFATYYTHAAGFRVTISLPHKCAASMPQCFKISF